MEKKRKRKRKEKEKENEKENKRKRKEKKTKRHFFGANTNADTNRFIWFLIDAFTTSSKWEERESWRDRVREGKRGKKREKEGKRGGRERPILIFFRS
jgi:hypothetical protein